MAEIRHSCPSHRVRSCSFVFVSHHSTLVFALSAFVFGPLPIVRVPTFTAEPPRWWRDGPPPDLGRLFVAVKPRVRLFSREQVAARDGTPASLAPMNRILIVLLVTLFPIAALAQPVSAERQMVAAAHPLAAEAGLAVLRAGGNAVDAAIATQIMLTLVEPQAAGIGGSTFMTVARPGQPAIIFDGRETAPAATRADHFLDAGGKPLPYASASMGGRAVGVPGMIAAFALAHAEQGKLPWPALFKPTIDLAERGFAISPRMAWSIDRFKERLRADADSAAYFLTITGEGKPVGTLLRNPALAETLRAVARDGAAAFHTGPIARAVTEKVRFGPRPGALNEADMAAYRAVRREALCFAYRVAWRVCGPPPPSSGTATLAQIMTMIETAPLKEWRAQDARAWHALLEASRLAFADRAKYMGDAPLPDFLLDRAYLDKRRALIAPERSMGQASAGTNGTSHVSTVDAGGLVVSMTSSVGDPFGGGMMAAGFVLNNELADFDFTGTGPNAPAPGRRPRSSMAPVIVFDAGGAPVLAAGSQGGSRIIGFVAKILVASLDWDMDPQAAIDLPHVLNRNGPSEIEEGPGRADLQAALEKLGHQVQRAPIDSGQQAIRLRAGRLEGGGDKRREGVAMGD
jgi:gamma-glutamyltranspeptidase/glutathione hydrolase